MTRDPIPTRTTGAPVDGGCDDPGCTCHQASDFTVLQSNVSRLALEIADEAARSDVECMAADAGCYFNLMPCYQTSALNADLPTDDDIRESCRATLSKAVRYLDLRGLLVRPDAKAPELVCFRRGA